MVEVVVSVVWKSLPARLQNERGKAHTLCVKWGLHVFTDGIHFASAVQFFGHTY